MASVFELVFDYCAHWSAFRASDPWRADDRPVAGRWSPQPFAPLRPARRIAAGRAEHRAVRTTSFVARCCGRDRRGQGRPARASRPSWGRGPGL